MIKMKYYTSDPYRVNVRQTIRHNRSLIDAYIDTYMLDHDRDEGRFASHMIEFALRYILVKTCTHADTPRWMRDFLDMHLRTDRPLLDIHASRIVYFPLFQKPDRAFMYLRDRETGLV